MGTRQAIFTCIEVINNLLVCLLDEIKSKSKNSFKKIVLQELGPVSPYFSAHQVMQNTRHQAPGFQTV